MKKTIFISLLGLSLLTLGCATSGKVTESKPLKADLAKYRTVQLKVTAEKEEFKKYVKPLHMTVKKHMTEAKPNLKIVSSKSRADLVVELKINHFESGSGVSRFFNMGGEAKITAKGRILDRKSKKVLSQFDLEGTSLEERQTTIGGFNLKWTQGMDKRTLMALESAGLYFSRYIAGVKND